MSSVNNLPQHIAIIMDGNRRWARKKGLAIIKGHRRVAEELIEELADHCIKKGIGYLTLWAFSTQNWNRNLVEVRLMMDLFREMLDKNTKQLHQKGIKIKTIGDLSRFDQDIRQKIKRGVEKTKQNQNLTLTFALNYGG
ncbi:di-trans,poly-cis-decaprenylcistransferase, partial [Patescibacteria group bacterium]|nr:di-trans,poly-cis-decaprenylcistransferase [Patescibacteria group bacterium]